MCMTWCRRRLRGAAPRRSSGSRTSWARSAARTSARCSRRCSTRAPGPPARCPPTAIREAALERDELSRSRSEDEPAAAARGGRRESRRVAEEEDAERRRSSPFRPSPSSRCWPRERVCAGPDADEPGEEGARRGVVAIGGRQLRGRRDRRGGGVRRPVSVGRRRPRRWHGFGAAAERGDEALRASAGRPVRGALPVRPRAALVLLDRLDDRSDDAVQEAGRRGAHPAVVPDRVGLAANPRRDPPSRRLGLRAGTGARQRRGRLDGDEPSTDRLRALGDAREPEEEAPLRPAQRQDRAPLRDRRRAAWTTGRRAAASRSPTSCG